VKALLCLHPSLPKIKKCEYAPIQQGDLGLFNVVNVVGQGAEVTRAVGRAPAEDARQVIAGAQGQNTELAVANVQLVGLMQDPSNGTIAAAAQRAKRRTILQQPQTSRRAAMIQIKDLGR